MILIALLLSVQSDDPRIFKPDEQPQKMLYVQLQADCAKEFDKRRQDAGRPPTD